MAGHDKTSVGTGLIVASSVLGVVALITTCMRLTVRCSQRVFGSDDVVMLAALASTIVRYSVGIHAVTVGYGHHRADLTNEEYIEVLFLNWLAQIFLFIALCLLKISIALLIMRIKDSRQIRIFQWAIITILAVSNVEVVVVLLAQCQPVSAYWRPEAGKCWPSKIRIYSIYSQVAISIITDLIYSLMPVILVWNLKMKTKRKVMICGLMCLGLTATFCAAMRARSLDADMTDLSWDYAIASIWSNIELGLGVIAANMVLMRSYLTFFRGERSLSIQTSSSPRYANQYALSRVGWRRQDDATAVDGQTSKTLVGRDTKIEEVAPG